MCGTCCTDRVGASAATGIADAHHRSADGRRDRPQERVRRLSRALLRKARAAARDQDSGRAAEVRARVRVERLAKTLVGFLAGIIGTQFIVTASLPRFVVFFAATALHAVVFMGLYVLLDLRHFGAPVAAVAGQATANAVVGVVAFQLVELLPGAVERRRAGKSRLRR